ncbi:MAG: TonB-dependent siderophore receptor [Vicinamibacterales bacterium]
MPTRRRRRGTARLFVLGTTLAMSTNLALAETHPPAGRRARAAASGVAAAAASEGSQDVLGQAFEFAVPAGPLDAAAAAFTAATRINVVFGLDSIGSIHSPGASGRLTADAALRVMLAGTGLSARFESGRVVFEVARLSEDVQVVGVGTTAVSSPKYVVPLRNVPQTVAVVPRDIIEKQGAFTLSEALRNVPGVTLQAGEGGGASNTAGDMFNLRGFSASNSLFLDGVRDDGLITRDVYNIEQVEVFMGPTGSDVGRSTAGGYVNQVTKAPTLQASRSAMLSLGSASQRRATVDVNVPLSKTADTWATRSALRLNAVVQDSGVVSRDFVSAERRGVAPSVALGIGTGTRVTVSGQFMRQENTPDYGVPGAAYLEAPLAPTTARAPRNVDVTNYYGTRADYDDASQNSVTGRFEHDVNRHLSIRNLTRYNQTHRVAVVSAIQNVAAYNPATELVTLSRQGNDRENTIVSNQTNVTARFSTGTMSHASTFGVEFTDERQEAPTLGNLGTPTPVNLYNPVNAALVPGAAPARTGALSVGKAMTAAAYLFDTVDVSPRVQLSGGLRAERYTATVRANDAAGAITTDLTARDTLLSGRGGVVVRLSSMANLYASYGATATPPGTANFTLNAQPNNQNNPSTRPQRSTNYEGGGKWDAAGGRLSLNGAVFHTINTNVIFTVDATAIPPIFNQDDEQTVTGFTAGALGKLTDRWQVLANVGVLKGTFKSQAAANNGNQLLLTPTVSGSVWGTYQASPALSVGGGVRFTEGVFINAANTIRMPGYAVLDALAEYTVSPRLSFRLNVYNLTDRDYIKSVNNNGGRFNPGQGLSFLLTPTIRF